MDPLLAEATLLAGRAWKLISPLVGETSGRTEGDIIKRKASVEPAG